MEAKFFLKTKFFGQFFASVQNHVALMGANAHDRHHVDFYLERQPDKALPLVEIDFSSLRKRSKGLLFSTRINKERIVALESLVGHVWIRWDRPDPRNEPPKKRIVESHT